MTSALIAGTQKMNILQMVLGVKTTIALVRGLEQHSCNTDRTHKFTYTTLVVSEIHHTLF